MVRVKICGITNAADALAAVDAGANLLGFNFYEKSARYLTENVEAVGIFVNASAADIAALCNSLRFHAAQLHGDESPEAVAELARSIPVIKAFRVEPEFSLKTLHEYCDASAFLFDAATTGQYG